MNIFDLFTFKKEAAKVFTPENFKIIMEKARTEIINQINNNILGSEKKSIVDNIIIAKIRELRSTCKNKVLRHKLICR